MHQNASDIDFFAQVVLFPLCFDELGTSPIIISREKDSVSEHPIQDEQLILQDV